MIVELKSANGNVYVLVKNISLVYGYLLIKLIIMINIHLNEMSETIHQNCYETVLCHVMARILHHMNYSYGTSNLFNNM